MSGLRRSVCHSVLSFVAGNHSTEKPSMLPLWRGRRSTSQFAFASGVALGTLILLVLGQVIHAC